MSGYRPGYSESSSPTYRQGIEDGLRDAEIMSSCPPGSPIGPTPPNPDYPVMYTRGYDLIMQYAMSHVCGPGCERWERQQAELRRQEQQRREQEQRDAESRSAANQGT